MKILKEHKKHALFATYSISLVNWCIDINAYPDICSPYNGIVNKRYFAAYLIILAAFYSVTSL